MAKQKAIIRLARIGDKVRLVRAQNVNQVRAHVSKDLIKVTVPTQDELIEFAKQSIEVEDVNETPEPDAPREQKSAEAQPAGLQEA